MAAGTIVHENFGVRKVSNKSAGAVFEVNGNGGIVGSDRNVNGDSLAGNSSD